MIPWWAATLIAIGAFAGGFLTMAVAYAFTRPRDIQERHTPIIGKRFRGIE